MKKILLSIFALVCASNLFAADRISIKDFLEKKDTETVYEICGEITSIKNTKYGNFYVNDGTAEIYIYGLGEELGTITQNLLTTLGIQEGDEIVVQGSYGEYNGTPEIINAQYISHVSNGAGVDITNTPETAYTTSQAWDIITVGKGLSTMVYVKGTVSPDNMDFSEANGNYTYTITDGVKDIIVFRGKYFNGDKFTSADQLQDGDEVIVYGLLVNYNGTYEIQSNSSIYSINGKTQPDVDPYTLTGNGTKDKPYTIADVLNLYSDATNTPTEAVWVTGTILGNVNTSTGATVVPNVFTDVNGDGVVDKNDCGEGETAAVATNLSVGDVTGKNIAVQLPTGDVRAALNILDNPGNIGKTVAVLGLIQKYCGVAGVKSVTDYVLEGASGINSVADDAAKVAIYNIAGQKVSANYNGIIIVNGKKYMNK